MNKLMNLKSSRANFYCNVRCSDDDHTCHRNIIFGSFFFSLILCVHVLSSSLSYSSSSSSSLRSISYIYHLLFFIYIYSTSFLYLSFFLLYIMALHHQPPQSSKHWWPRKASTVGSNFRQNKQVPSSIPTPLHSISTLESFQNFDEKRPSSSHVPSFDKPSSKFDSIVSAIGLKTKKSAHSIIDIQEPPLPSLPVPSHPLPPRIRTASSNTSRNRPSVLSAPSPDAAMSSSTSHSWDDSLEPLTPSDPSPRSSFYPSPSLLPSDPFRASSPRQYSALSDKSFLDTQGTDSPLAPTSPRSSRTSASVNSSLGHNISLDPRTAVNRTLLSSNSKAFSE